MKGLILAAGYGTRFLPITKTIPKEMLPLGTRPALDYVIQEFIESGIRDIVIVNSRRKKTLEDYFDREPETEEFFFRNGMDSHLRKIQPPDAQLYFVRQQLMNGPGAAVLLVREILGGEPCVLAFPDDLHIGSPPLTRQLLDVHAQTGNAVLALEARPPEEDISRYGVAAVRADTDPLQVTQLVEKPARGTEPSRLISIGRYVLTPEVFAVLSAEQDQHAHGEFYLTPALNRLAQSGRLSGCLYTGERLDTGQPLGYYQAAVRVFLDDPANGPAFLRFLQTVVAERNEGPDAG